MMQVKFYTVKNSMNLSPVLHQKSLNNRKNTDFDYIVSVRFFFPRGFISSKIHFDLSTGTFTFKIATFNLSILSDLAFIGVLIGINEKLRTMFTHGLSCY